MSVPIFASEEVLDEAAILIPDEDDDEVEKFREFLDYGDAGGLRGRRPAAERSAVEEDRHPDLAVHARDPDGHVAEPVVRGCCCRCGVEDMNAVCSPDSVPPVTPTFSPHMRQRRPCR